MDLTRKQGNRERQDKSVSINAFEGDLLKQYNAHILSILVRRVSVMLDNQTILEDVLHKLKGRSRPKKEGSTKRKAKHKKG